MVSEELVSLREISYVLLKCTIINNSVFYVLKFESFCKTKLFFLTTFRVYLKRL